MSGKDVGPAVVHVWFQWLHVEQTIKLMLRKVADVFDSLGDPTNTSSTVGGCISTVVSESSTALPFKPLKPKSPLKKPCPQVKPLRVVMSVGHPGPG